MIRLIQRRLIIPRGDTGSFSIPILAGKNTGDVAVFTVFDLMTQKKLLEKTATATNDTLTIEFNHNDTVNLPVGQFVWDIKYYVNPVFADGKLVDGEEIDSYYAAFTLPVCEIRQTGDMMLMVNDAALPPDQLDILLATLNATIAAKNEAVTSAAEADTSATNAETSASAALASEQAALESQNAALASQQAAAASAQQALAGAELATIKAEQIAADISNKADRSEIPIKVSDLTDDSGHYTKPANGIPASDLEETYLTEHQDLNNYVQKTDYASTNTAGIVKVNDANGITIYDNTLLISPASKSIIQVGTDRTHPIVSYRQHQAVFYGLAKAAGSDEKNSELPVGQYTNAAKAAIQQMLDVPSTADIPTVPTNVSAFTNDAGYLTAHQDISGKANVADLAIVATSGDYEDLSNKPTIPDVQINETSIVDNGIANIPYGTASRFGVYKVKGDYGTASVSGTLGISKATNDEIKSGIQTMKPIVPYTQNISVFYGLAKAAGDTTQSQSDNAVGTYTDGAKTAIQTMLDVPSNAAMTTAIGTAIGNINSFDMAVVQALPTENISTHTIYLVPKTGETNDVYDEYVYINNAWEMVGNTQIDLSNYVQKTDYAESDIAGVIKVSPSTYGLSTDNNGYITIAGAGHNNIKDGTNNYRVTTIKNQHESAFYGLAKAAGSDEKNSELPVGQYTDAAKTAIQTMLDVPSNTDLALKADKTDTVLETTLSRGRKDNTTTGGASLAFGINTEASGYYSVALGLNTTASSQGAYAEGKGTVAHYIAHAEGEDSQALSSWSHAQNLGTIANGGASSASGRHTIANGADSFVIGKYNAEDSYDNWPTWTANTSYEVGDRVKRNLMVQNEPTDVGYHCTVANSDATFDIAHWELDGYHMNYVEIVGNGKEYEDPETHQTVRAGSNAYALEWNGTAHYMGNIYVGANADSTGGTRVATIAEVATKLDAAEAGLKVVRLI